jgi:hypothetical protein
MVIQLLIVMTQQPATIAMDGVKIPHHDDGRKIDVGGNVSKDPDPGHFCKNSKFQI